MASTCRIAECGEPAFGNALCAMHYARVRRTGSADGIRRRTGRPRTSPEARFWSMVSKDGPIPVHRPELGSCWTWVGNKGGSHTKYIRFTLGGRYGKTTSAHRFSYELANGPIPDGLTVDHLCRNTSCVNPSHLEAVTGRVNVLRGNTITAANAAKTHCKRGHPFTEENTRMEGNGRLRRCRTCRREAQRVRRSQGE